MTVKELIDKLKSESTHLDHEVKIMGLNSIEMEEICGVSALLDERNEICKIVIVMNREMPRDAN